MNIDEFNKKLDAKTKLIDELWLRKRELITLHKGIVVPELSDLMFKIEKEERNLANFKYRNSKLLKAQREKLIEELTRKTENFDIFS